MIDLIRSSLLKIAVPRFFETERGFQGQLVTNLNLRLDELGLGRVLVEQEYQKVMEKHGLRTRPDIIIHTPFEGSGLDDRRQGNLVAFELKLNATEDEAFSDFGKLEKMREALDYPLGIFININSNETYLENYTKRINIELHSYAVKLENNQVIIREFNLSTGIHAHRPQTSLASSLPLG